MPRILVLGDTHIHNHQAMGGPVINGINSRCRDIVRSILAVVAKEKPDAVVQLGDFFDVAKPPPAVLDLAMQIITKTKVPWYILAGNHDISTLGAPTAIRPLGHLPNVTIFEDPKMFKIGNTDCMAIPYCSLSAKEAVNTAFNQYGSFCPKLYFLHYGLEHNEHNGPDYIHLNATGSVAFHGHDHQGYSDSYLAAHNIGSFAELRFGERVLPASYAVVDTRRMYVDITCEKIGPIFLDDAGPALAKAPHALHQVLKLSPGATSVYLRVTPDRVTFAQELKSLGVIQDYAVLRQSKAGPIEQYAADFEKLDPLTSIAQVIVDRLEGGNMEEDQAMRILNLAKKELQL